MKTPPMPISARIFLPAAMLVVAAGATLVCAEQTKVTAKAFTNSLGMEMVPVKATPGLMWCVWETRNSDFDTYLADRGSGHRKPWLDQGSDHPVVNVSRSDAMGFCDWLTIRHIDAGLIPMHSRYILKGAMPGFTALHVSAAAGDLEMIRLLAGKGADLSAACGESITLPGMSRMTARDLAEATNKWAAAKLLRELEGED